MLHLRQLRSGCTLILACQNSCPEETRSHRQQRHLHLPRRASCTSHLPQKPHAIFLTVAPGAGGTGICNTTGQSTGVSVSIKQHTHTHTHTWHRLEFLALTKTKRDPLLLLLLLPQKGTKKIPKQMAKLPERERERECPYTHWKYAWKQEI